MFEWEFPTKRRRGVDSIPKIKHLKRPLRVGLEEKALFSYTCWPILQDHYFSNEESFFGRGNLFPCIIYCIHIYWLIYVYIIKLIKGNLNKSAGAMKSVPTSQHFSKVEIACIRSSQERSESLAIEGEAEENPVEWADFLYRHFLGCWFLCCPSMISNGKSH
jgi:hypothetical protein